jgi:uncharacterized glyoxalase superfamily protein PhnB
MAVKPIPDGYHTLTPHIVVNDAAKALDFYKKAFGARERARMAGPGGKIMHAEMQIGDSIVMMNDEFPDMGARGPLALGGTPVTLTIYTENSDQLTQQAIGAGASVVMPLADMFWGDRYGIVKDPFGHQWAICTHKEDLSHEEVTRRGAAAMAQMK